MNLLKQEESFRRLLFPTMHSSNHLPQTGGIHLVTNLLRLDGLHNNHHRWEEKLKLNKLQVRHIVIVRIENMGLG